MAKKDFYNVKIKCHEIYFSNKKGIKKSLESIWRTNLESYSNDYFWKNKK